MDSTMSVGKSQSLGANSHWRRAMGINLLLMWHSALYALQVVHYAWHIAACSEFHAVGKVTYMPISLHVLCYALIASGRKKRAGKSFTQREG